MKIIQSDSAYQITLSKRFQAPTCKNMEFYIFGRREDHGCVFIYLFFFFAARGDRIDQVVLEYRERAHYTTN